jgi:hypothetical protein
VVTNTYETVEGEYVDEYIFRRTFEWDRLVGIVLNETRRLGCFRPKTFIHPNLALNFKYKNHIYIHISL